MANSIVRDWNGKGIRIRADRYVCLTDMASASKKRFAQWYRLDTTKSYLEVLSVNVGIPTFKLVEVEKGRYGGTWGHPKVAIRFAQWCSDEFAVQVDCWVDELITTGSITLNGEKVFTLDMAVRRTPSTWERMFTPEWITQAERVTGWKWTWQCMGQFINDAVYAYLPNDIVETLRDLNPREEGKRKRNHTHHQFLQPEVREIIAKHLDDVEVLMSASGGDMQIFKIIMANKFGRFRLTGVDELPLFRTQTVFLLRSSQ